MPAFGPDLGVRFVRVSQDPERCVSLIGIATWHGKDLEFFRADVNLGENESKESTQWVRFPLSADLPPPRSTALLSVRYWLVTALKKGRKSKVQERWSVPFVPVDEGEATPLHLSARRSAKEPNIEFALRSSRVGKCIEGALSVQESVCEPVRVELHQVVKWRPYTLRGDREERAVAVSMIAVEKLGAGETCFFAIPIPEGSMPSWTHRHFNVRWFIRVHANFGTATWSFDVDVDVVPGRDDGERSPKKVPRVGTRRRMHELRRFASGDLQMEGESLVATYGTTRLAINYGLSFNAELSFPDLGVDLGDRTDEHALRCLRLLLAGNIDRSSAASCSSLALRFHPQKSSELRNIVESMEELARTLEDSIAHLPVPPEREAELPHWQRLAEQLMGSLSPAGLVLRTRLQRQELWVAPHKAGLRFVVPCAVDTADPRLVRFETMMRKRHATLSLVHDSAKITLFVQGSLGGPEAVFGPVEAATLAHELTGFVAELARAGAYR